MDSQYKGFIYAPGPCVTTHEVFRDFPNLVEEVANVPVANYSVSLLLAAGVQSIMVASTASSLPGYQEAFKDCAEIQTNISYLLVGDNAGAASALAGANEFIAHSNLVMATSGACLLGLDYRNALRKAMRENKGATNFPMCKELAGSENSVPEILLLDRKSSMAAEFAKEKYGSSANFAEIQEFYEDRAQLKSFDQAGECFYLNLATANSFANEQIDNIFYLLANHIQSEILTAV